ncbi:MBL fold metallo-hydrolase [Mangrovivirga sp. M17]|uniref:MBL fold metallo-hydrolase n=1 Tax=Mangrovivirga halotolerans TaxID=2993936 RepID=A0ABT3RQG1_9BACT|nr:MBL fold metallo-hydrolase [Mangrovivirga halotolerans]MCX2743778.1 MBL fold metallo-hydrolase [Mangrovivirga halotolerans]
MKPIKFTVLLLLIFSVFYLKAQQEKSNFTQQTSFNKKRTTVSSLKITTLSTMLANRGLGEWGYSALVEVDRKKILFDTGSKPETVLKNAKELGIDLSDVEDVFLSHNHRDHTGGLLTLRKELKKVNPKALSRVHVGMGIFSHREDRENHMLSMKKELEADGVEFIIYSNQHELFPGVWITGPIERIHEERNWSGNVQIKTDNGTIEDNIPEDQSLVIDTEDGFVLISGCGHAGIINTIEHVRLNIHEEKVFAAIGGFHLVNASDEHLKWTADKLLEFGVSKIIGAHCTGINSLYMLRTMLNMSRSDAVVGSVGDSFDLKNGIQAGYIAR